MAPDPSVYDYLSKQNISQLTVENLNSMVKVSAIDPNNIKFWSGVITVSRAMEHSRTFGYGLPIPETGSTETLTIADGANAPIKPTGTEVWRVENIHFDNCSVALSDVDGNFSIIATVDAIFNGPIFISSKLFLTFFNGSGSEQTPTIAYFKVAL